MLARFVTAASFVGAFIAAQDPASEPAADAVPLVLRVNDAVDRGAQFLFAQQAEDGSWRKDDRVHPTGRTALTLLALVHAGFPQSEPHVKSGLDWLLAQLRARRETTAGGAGAAGPYRSTYETGITLMLLHDLGNDARFAPEMAPLADWLCAVFDEGQLLWGYPDSTRDLSNTQYAILGLRAAERSNVRPKDVKETLAKALRGVLRLQQKDGGFAYQPGKFATASMTVAGLAVARYIEEALKTVGSAQKDLHAAESATPRAQAWLDEHFSVKTNPAGRALENTANVPYYLYGLERYAAFYGLKEIAGHDWYAEGAAHLLDLQQDDGSFGNLEETCFAILFLRKASITMPGEAETERLKEGLESLAREKQARPKPLQIDSSVPFLRDWLVAGPFPGSAANDDALEIDAVGEAKERPVNKSKAGKKKWSTWQAPADGKVDFKKVFPGAPCDFVASYAACYVTCDAPKDALLWLYADDGVRVFLDGKLVFDHHHHDPMNDLKAPLALPQGTSCLMVKLENTTYDCIFTARLCTREGGPIAGVVVDTKR